MGIKINPNRRFTFDIVDGEQKASVTFDFLTSVERSDWDSVDAIRSIPNNGINFYVLNLRCALVAWEGFSDEATGEPIPFSMDAQRAIFDYVSKNQEVYAKVRAAYAGENDAKNSIAGLPQSSNSDGCPALATDANSTDDVDDA